jgi:hypothetical protein
VSFAPRELISTAGPDSPFISGQSILAYEERTAGLHQLLNGNAGVVELHCDFRYLLLIPEI